jgi:hypothetical protein
MSEGEVRSRAQSAMFARMYGKPLESNETETKEDVDKPQSRSTNAFLESLKDGGTL